MTGSGRMRVVNADEGVRPITDRTTMITAVGEPENADTRKRSVAYWYNLAMKQGEELRRMHTMIGSIHESAVAIRGALTTALGQPPERAIGAIAAIRPETRIDFKIEARHLQTILNLI